MSVKEKIVRGIAVNNAAINTIHTMLRVRVHAEEQTSCLQATSSVLAAESAVDVLKVLHELVDVHGQNIRDVLEKTMENLQDILVTAIQDILAACEVSPDIRVVLRLSLQGQLSMEGEGPIPAMVQNSLDANPLLTSLFNQIQARAMILRALDDVKAGLDVCLELQEDESYERAPVYKLCIKGTLSHFYIQ